ncbi:phage tail tape measure protein [uncultured Desulfovibrio sp.]|uniref:phage tail tape measure protein n=1 Tax=uncultured Desulfovibrio sp. TaxID=167968 RepID=UPI00260E0404|nr:phage tail tape measure protein [uncultured Desulfovibrio sp.]
MAKEVSVSFRLGATLAGSYRTAFQDAAGQARMVSQAIREMGNTPVGQLGAALEKQGAKLTGLAGKLEKAEAKLAGLRAQAESAGAASSRFASRIKAAENRVLDLTAELAINRQEMQGLAQQAGKVSGSVQTLQADYAGLVKRMEQARAVRSALQTHMANSRALQAERQDLHSRLLGTAAVGATAAIPVKLAVSAEDVFADLRKVMDAPEEVMQQLSADAQAMSNRTGKSFEDIVAIMTAAAQAGLGKTREEMLGVAEQATKMSIAWGVSAEQAGKSLATWQAAMGLTTEQSRHTADVINALSNEMNAEAGDIDQIFTRMGPLLKASGFATQDIAALATAFKAAGAEVEVSGTAMKNFIKVMAAGEAGLTDQRKAIYKYLQIDPNELQKQLQTDAMGAVMRVLEALQRVRPEERNSISSLLFGEESIAAIAPLMTELKTLRQAVSIANSDVSGSVDQEYANRMKTTATSLAKVTQSARNLGVTVGTALLPMVGAVADKGASVLGVIRDLARRFPHLTGVVMTAGAGLATLAVGGVALGLVLNVLRTAANGFGGMLLRMNAAQLTAAGGARTLTFWQRASALASLSWRDILTGVGGRLSALMGLLRGATLSTVALTAVQRACSAGTAVLSGGLRLVGVALRFAMGPMGVVFTAVTVAAGLIIDNWSTVGPFFHSLWSGIVSVFQWAWGIIKGIMESVAEAATWIGKKIDEMPVLGSAKRGIGKAIDWFSGEDEKEQPAANAKAAAEQSAAPNARAAADKASAAKAPPMPDLPKGPRSKAPDTLTGLASASGSESDYFKQSFNDFMASEEAAKKKGKKGGGSRAAGGTTVVTLAGDNSQVQSLYIPAGSRTGVPLSTPHALPQTITVLAPAQTAGRVGTPTALPQTPARLARRGGKAAQAAGSNGQIMVDLTQNFSLMSSDPRAVRRVLESIKPDMEALIRRALDKIASDRRRTAYA